jgi:hypothetical protein
MRAVRLSLFVLAIAAGGQAALAEPPAVVTDSQAQARSAANVGADAASTRGSFAIGMPVVDVTGVSVGRITRLTTAKDGQTLVMVRKGVDAFSVPASVLRMQNGAAVGDVSLDQMKALGAAASR